jgi:hypothetical protein
LAGADPSKKLSKYCAKQYLGAIITYLENISNNFTHSVFKKVTRDLLQILTEKIFKPSLKGSWVLVFGSILGPFILITGRHRDASIWPWLVLTTLFVAFFLHRLSLSYTLSKSELTLSSWWGLGQRETITLSDVDRIEIIRSFSMRIVNQAHIYIHSNHPSEGSLTILAQSNPENLVSELSKHSKYLKNEDSSNDNLEESDSNNNADDH